MKASPPLLAVLFLLFSNPFSGHANTAWANNITLSPPTACAGVANCYTFHADVSSVTGQLKYFWFFDDGFFSQDVSPTHTFFTDGNHTVYVEITRLYEKDDKPKRIVVSGTFTGNGTTAETTTTTVPIDILSNRMPKAGDSITYVITYGKWCNEQFKPLALSINYNVAQMTLVEAKHLYNSTPATPTNQIIYSSLNSPSDGLVRRIFLTFEVSETVQVNDQVLFGAVLTYEGQGCSPQEADYSQLAVPSHDPNYIVADINTICRTVSLGDPITYTIEFQNTGSAPANEVEVRTYMPLFFSNTYVTGGSGYNGWLAPNREIRWKLSTKPGAPGILNGGQPLRGTGEPGYGSTFFEEDTRDRIKYTVTFDPIVLASGLLNACQTIVNRAEIIFDCNPSIFTNFYSTDIQCPHPVPGSCYCDGSPEIVKNSSIMYGGGAGVPLAVMGSEVVWYPPVFLSNDRAQNPDATPNRSIDYVAVVRDGCQRYLYQVPVLIDCDLKVDQTLTMKSCNTASVKGDLVLRALTAAPSSHLVWNMECTDLIATKSGYDYIVSDLAPGIHYFTVKDTVNGCWAETTVKIPSTCKKKTIRWSPVLAGTLVLAGLGLLIWFFGRLAAGGKK